MVDIRAEGNASVIRNDAMINTLYASRDGVHVITGDAQGMLKVWDIRSSKCIIIFFSFIVLFIYSTFFF